MAHTSRSTSRPHKQIHIVHAEIQHHIAKVATSTMLHEETAPTCMFFKHWNVVFPRWQVIIGGQLQLSTSNMQQRMRFRQNIKTKTKGMLFPFQPDFVRAHGRPGAYQCLQGQSALQEVGEENHGFGASTTSSCQNPGAVHLERLYSFGSPKISNPCNKWRWEISRTKMLLPVEVAMLWGNPIYKGGLDIDRYWNLVNGGCSFRGYSTMLD